MSTDVATFAEAAAGRARVTSACGGEHRLIELTRGRFALVDAVDFERLSEHKWYVAGRGETLYAVRKVGQRTVGMHREILRPPPGMLCDHINHDGLDNRRANLRICTPSQNQQNRRPTSRGTSRYKGVCWHRDARKWEATIGHNGRQVHIGYYDYEQDAAIAYDDRAIELFGEFACLNCQYRPEIALWVRETYLFAQERIEAALGA